MHWSFRVGIRFIIRAIINLIIIEWPESFIRMLMSPDLKVNTVLVEQIFQGKPAIDI